MDFIHYNVTLVKENEYSIHNIGWGLILVILGLI